MIKKVSYQNNISQSKLKKALLPYFKMFILAFLHTDIQTVMSADHKMILIFLMKQFIFIQIHRKYIYLQLDWVNIRVVKHSFNARSLRILMAPCSGKGMVEIWLLTGNGAKQNNISIYDIKCLHLSEVGIYFYMV